jgi:hypothetical protein
VVRWGGGAFAAAAKDLIRVEGAGRRSRGMQGPRGPGSPGGDRRRGNPSRVTGEALRRGDRCERPMMRKADDQPSVNVPLRANPIVHYTIKSTVNGHITGDVHPLHSGKGPGVRGLRGHAAVRRRLSLIIDNVLCEESYFCHGAVLPGVGVSKVGGKSRTTEASDGFTRISSPSVHGGPPCLRPL